MIKRLLRILLTVLFLCVTAAAFATHNRAGEICYTHVGGLTFEFTVITYTDPDSQADRDSLTVVFDERDPVISSVTIPRATEQILIAGTIKKNTYVHQYTFPGPDCYIVSMEDPNRVEGICNIDGSVNVPFYLEDTICIVNPTFYGYNSSPILTNPPIDNAVAGTPFEHIPGAYDPDGDSLVFSLIVPKQDHNVDVPGYEFPDEFDGCGATLTIDKQTGRVLWDAPCQCCTYNIAILIREFRDGVFLGSKIRDLQIFSECTINNDPPILSEIRDTCMIAGQNLEILVSADDPNGDNIELSANGGPFEVATSPAEFSTVISSSPVGQVFRWQTICDHIRETPYQVVFRAQDDFSEGSFDFPLTDLQSWLITVVAPPPENLAAFPIGNRVELSWDSLYQCFGSQNFQGFSVWRRTGCDSNVVLPDCQRGLGGTDYVKIADLVDRHSYTDFDVVRGPVYSYRVVAEFGESPPGSPNVFNEVGSRPSEAVCVELKRDLPVMTNASVEVTDPVNGEVFVAWVAPDPDDLDTLINQGPYRYVLNRDGTPVVTFTSATFAGYEDTSYTDTGLDTETLPHIYSVDFFATDEDGNEISVGTATSASTVFLGTGFGDNILILNWTESVPWSNYLYEVQRETLPGSDIYDSLTVVSSPPYVDDSLVNGREYCYRIRAIGTYGSANLPDSLVNFSQRICGIPMDTVPSCPPTLTVDNICSEAANVPFDPVNLFNDLTWSNPNNFCADDVIGYNVYYAPVQSANTELLVSLSDALDTTFRHEGLSSLAGCYTVTAIDSFNNESSPSNVICVDNCPRYELPNVFTPNNDGANDFFTPFLPFRFIESIDIQIFDRWGGLVYQTNDPVINWDGNAPNGKPLAEGVYYYVCNVIELTVEGLVPREEPLSGYIHLIRGNGSSNP